jgi:serine/threonine protein kinase
MNQDGPQVSGFQTDPPSEAQVLASLNHPNIAGIYGIEQGAIVAELVEGIEPAGPRTAEAALPLIHQLIDALDYAHDKGILHSGLKTSRGIKGWRFGVYWRRPGTQDGNHG